MKQATIELLNLVMIHCKQTESDSAFQTLQDIDDLEFKHHHYINCILSCLNDLKKEFEDQKSSNQ